MRKCQKYVDGWVCPGCDTDNPDELSPCVDTEFCVHCGHPRPPETFKPPREPS